MNINYIKSHNCSWIKDILYFSAYYLFHASCIGTIYIILPLIISKSTPIEVIYVVINVSLIFLVIIIVSLVYSYISSKLFIKFRYTRSSIYDCDEINNTIPKAQYYIIYDFKSYKKSYSRNVNIDVYMTLLDTNTSNEVKNISLFIKLPASLIKDVNTYCDKNKLKTIIYHVIDDTEIKNLIKSDMVEDVKLSRRLKLEMLNK